MPERFCPNCRESVGDARYCPECGEHIPRADEADESGETEPTSPADQSTLLPPPPPEDEASPPPADPDEERDGDEAEPEPHPEFAPPAEFEQSDLPETPLPEQVAHPVSESPSEPGPPPADGQLRCQYCAESAYKDEVLCWACRRRLEDHAVVQEPSEPVVGAMNQPESGAPMMDPPDASQVDERAADRLAQAQAQASAQPPSEAVSYAWWSFGLGLISVFTCGALGLLGIAAVWLGVLASRKGAGPMAVAGTVFGALGVLMFLVIVTAAVLLLGGNAGAPPDYVLLLGVAGGLS